ncbi:MAG: hypothetical protein L0H70_02960 [Xanthomonadales bacterium]|nr:hypothetical protein [Xanthomonadales bacterium]
MNQKRMLSRGLVAGALWLVLQILSYAYVAGKGDVQVVFAAIVKTQPILLYGWSLVSLALMYFAIRLIAGSMIKRGTTPST